MMLLTANTWSSYPKTDHSFLRFVVIKWKQMLKTSCQASINRLLRRSRREAQLQLADLAGAATR